MSLRSMLRQRCKVERWSSRVPHSSGVLQSGYETVATNVPCLIQDKNATLEATVGGRNVTFDAEGFFKQRSDIRPGRTDTEHPDRVTLTRNGTGVYLTRGTLDEAGHQRLKTVRLKSV